MTLRSFLASWLRGLRPTSRTVQAVKHESDGLANFWAEYDRGTREAYRAWQAEQADYLEALMCLPTVEPDYQHHTYPYGTANLVDGGKWLADVWPMTWGKYDDNTRELTAGIWLGKRADLQHGELVS